MDAAFQQRQAAACLAASWQQWCAAARLPALHPAISLAHTSCTLLLLSARSIGYRTAINGDIQLPASLASKVHIYTSASTGGKDPKVSALRATMLGELRILPPPFTHPAQARWSSNHWLLPPARCGP